MTILSRLSSCTFAIFFAAATLSSAAVHSQAKSSFHTFLVPGSTQTVANAINKHGVIVGWADGGAYTTTVGFSFDTKRNIYEVITCPAASGTFANGINDDNVIVGGCIIDGAEVGFAEQDSNFTFLSIPEANGLECLGINNVGQIVGAYTDPNGTYGFVYSNFEFTTIRHGANTFVNGINDSGELAGSDGPGRYTRGFIKLKHFETIIYPAPGVRDTSVNGLNDAGDLVGYWRGPVPSGDHGFVFNNSDSTFTSIDLGDGTDTICSGINSSGEIVGTYSISGGGNTIYGFYGHAPK